MHHFLSVSLFDTSNANCGVLDLFTDLIIIIICWLVFLFFVCLFVVLLFLVLFLFLFVLVFFRGGGDFIMQTVVVFIA